MIKKVILLVLIFNIALLSCGGGWDYNHKSFLFLEKRELPFSNQPRDLKGPSVYNNILYDYEIRAKEANLKEWQKHLKQTLDLETIEQIVYKREKLSLLKDEDIKEYLNFVQNQELHVIEQYYQVKKPQIKEEILIFEALKRINSNIDQWLKLRYFYLSLRLAHYKKLNPLKIYDEYKYLLNTKEHTIVKDWIQGIYAGALIKDGAIEKGVYEFSKLLEKDKINWHLSYYNFHHIKTSEQWNTLINIPTSKYEKTKLLAMRALNKNSNIIEELKNIYAIDKNSIWFDFILYRALRDSQHFFDLEHLFVRNFQTKQFMEYLKSIKKDDMYMVNLSLGYFNLYSNNLKKAKEIANKLLITNNNHETQTFNYIVNLHQLKNINLEIENDIYSQLMKLTSDKNHTSKALHDYTFVILEKLYKNENKSFKAFLSANINYLDNNSFNLARLNDFKEFMSSKSKSKIEDHFKEKYKEQKKIKKGETSFTFDESLKRTQIKLLINNQEFKEASMIKSEYLDKLIIFNPFNVSIKGNNYSGKKRTYTVKQFLNKIIEIEAVLNKNPNSVIDNYLYANSLYNISYFGNSTILTTEYRSPYSFRNKEIELKKINDSIKYYEKALKYAKKDEFKAKITYMLAKSELALFDINFSKKSDYNYFYSKDIVSYDFERQWRYMRNDMYKKYIDNNYGKYFDKLKKDFSNTKYYDEILRECANLRTYQKRK